MLLFYVFSIVSLNYHVKSGPYNIIISTRLFTLEHIYKIIT